MPASLPGVDPSLTGLSIAAPVGAGPFRVEGGRACVSGHQRAPVGRVELYGVGVVDDFRMGADRAANLVVFPGMTRRDFIGRAGLYVETIVVAPDLPLVAVCRGGHAPDEGSGTFSVIDVAEGAQARAVFTFAARQGVPGMVRSLVVKTPLGEGALVSMRGEPVTIHGH